VIAGWLCRAAVAVAAGCGLASPLAAQSAVPSRIALDDGAAPSPLAVLEAAGPLPFPVAVRIESSATESAVALDARLTALGQRKIPVWLSLSSPESPDEVDAWRARLRALLARHGPGLTVLEIDADRQPVAVVRFAVQTAATEVGAGQRAIRVALGGPAMRDSVRRTQIYSADLAPYVDLLAIPADQAEAIDTWLQQVDPQAELAQVSGATRPPTDRAFLQGTLEQLGSKTAIRAWRAPDVPSDALRALVPLAALLTHEVFVIDDASAALAMTRAGVDVSASLRHALLIDAETFATYFAYWGDRADEALTVALSIRIDGMPRLFDLSTRTQTRVADAVLDGATGRTQMRLPLTGNPTVIDFNDGAKPFAERTVTSAERQLSVAEIIARHRRQQRAQDAALENYVAHARMEQHFRPTMADPGYDVVAENTYFAGRDGVEWAEISFAVNGSKWGSRRPPFPLLQPEKVLSLPLLLRFDEGYSYRLTGTARVGGFDCYVVKFEPARADSSLYRGTVWIDRRTFARIRVRAVQNGLPAPVISNDETHDYTLAATVGTQPVFLFTSLTARQLLLVAGRNLLVEKQVSFTDFRVNDPGFEQSRASARESDAVMFRETELGLRYYVKENGRRVVSDRPTRDLKALAMGVTLDPSYGFPLPLFGINYLDFHFRRPDTQLAVLFAGVLAAGNIQRSNLGGKNVDASVDFFAIAAPSSDRLYGPDGEDPSVRVLTWPLSTGLNLGWQATPFQKATLQYQFRFDGYVRDRTTSPDFVVPSSTVTNGIGGAWEYRRGGYSLVSTVAWFRRAAWKAWGNGSVTSPGFVKYSAAMSRDYYLGPFQKIHLNGAWFGSSDIDRFGTYQFGMFDDTRIHGVPASGVRFGEVAMARGSYSVNIFEQYRVDLFVEHAWGRTDARRGPWDRIPAVGMAINVRAPWDTILRVDAGKSLLPDRYRDLGSATLQILLLKPLR
jgi:hypothetical protein